MTRPSPRFRPLPRLRPGIAGPHSIQLNSPRATVELSVPAPGLFHIRVHPGAPLPASTSWAVLPLDTPAPDCTLHRDPDHVSLQTAHGELNWSLKTHAWSLKHNSLTLFESIPDSIGFTADQPRFSLRLAEREALYGLGESTGTFNKRGLIRDFWNIDVLGHAPAIHPSLRQLYVSVPFALSRRDGRFAGLFWDNPHRQSWDMGQTQPDLWQLSAAGGPIDLYLFTGPDAPDVVGLYTRLTGRIPMPPRWALGYHQSRYGYESAKQIRAVAKEFRQRQLPCDVLHLDIHHMDQYRVFTFGKSFPQPRRLIRDLAHDGFKVVTIVDPGVKDDPRFPVLRRGIQADAFVRSPDGESDFLGEVWPGSSRFPDFLKASTREWWAKEQGALSRDGVAGFWNDMNEPSNFARPDKTLPPDARHHTDFGPATHAAVHNLYGMQMSRASREGALIAQPGQRPFIITRATYAGGQRHAIVWTGDNSSHWDHLRDSIQMLLNLGLSGFPICGADAGGFMDNVTPELLVRWMQLAALTPFFRNHSNLGTVAQEPWAFGSDVEAICRSTLQLRYQLLPLLYSLTAEANRTGAPLMRPLFWHYPNDPVAAARGDQFLVGRDLLVAPILEQGSTARVVYLPNDTWYDFWTGQRFDGGTHHVAEAPLERLPLFVRAGALVPFAPDASHSEAQDLSIITLHVWPGTHPGLDWYEDDGQSMACEHGDWHRRRFTLRRMGRQCILQADAPTGSFGSRVQTWRILLHDINPRAHVQLDGRVAEVLHSPEDGIALIEIPNPSAGFELRFGAA